VLIRPEDLQLTADPEGTATVREQLFEGDTRLLRLEVGDRQLCARVDASQGDWVGRRATLRVRRPLPAWPPARAENSPP